MKKIMIEPMQLNEMPMVDDNISILNDFNSTLCIMGVYMFTLSFFTLFEFKIEGTSKEAHHVPGEDDVV